jgi:hypothetical protein
MRHGYYEQFVHPHFHYVLGRRWKRNPRTRIHIRGLDYPTVKCRHDYKLTLFPDASGGTKTCRHCGDSYGVGEY